jgi:peptidoglycan/xylan/chitin deacetylase (PgdA/CDA1 family)
MFHGVTGHCSPPPGQTPEEGFYDVSERMFELYLDVITEAGLETLTSHGLDSKMSNDAVTISFDDGRESDCVSAMPALVQRGMRGVFFVVTDWIGTPGYMNPAQVREMVKHGQDIQIHGKTHRFLTDLDDSSLRHELIAAKGTLEDLIGSAVTALSYPGGRGDKRVHAIAREVGFQQIYSSRPGWYVTGMTEIPRMVVHHDTGVAEVEAYMAGSLGPVIRQMVRYYGGRILRNLLGAGGYAKLKTSRQER